LTSPSFSEIEDTDLSIKGVIVYGGFMARQFNARTYLGAYPVTG